MAVNTSVRHPGLVSLYDGVGRVWIESYLNGEEYTRDISLQNIPSGLYFCRIEFANGERYTAKLLIANK